ncbi:MAG TPA: serine/threonine-protein kinase [Bryobacteraceae bacterium]|nr:serine/threonine-protein kinase [Bryobacteraceae bacterium]
MDAGSASQWPNVEAAFDPRYRLESEIGMGAFGVTYLAERVSDSTKVVVKLLSSGDADSQALFDREAKVSERLVHPNIVRLLASGTFQTRPYLVFEWIEGESLAQALKRGPLSVEDATRICLAVAGALQYAHSLGIIHRDLKPSNILLGSPRGATDPGAVKLVDFGVSGQLDPRSQLTRAGMSFGTPLYMSPEQVLGEPQTVATDVYALGLLLYEMLVGKALRQTTDTAVLFQSILREGAPAGDWPMPAYLAELVRACVQRDPSRRPSIVDLQRVLQQRGLSPETTQPVLLPPPLAHAPSPMAAPAPVLPHPATRAYATRRFRYIAIAAGILLVLVLASTLAVRTATKTAAPSPESSVSFSLVVIGIGLIVLGSGAGYWVRGMLSRPASSLRGAALGLALDAQSRVDVTATIAMQVTDLVSRLKELDARILAGTVALMLDEYHKATDAKDRQSALMNVVSLSEKLGQRISPWYVRYKDVIASAVAVVGAVSGLLTAYGGFHGHKP